MAWKNTQVWARLGPTGKDCDLWIDGKRVENCVGFEVKVRVDEITRITVETLTPEGSMAGLVETTAINQETRTYKHAEGPEPVVEYVNCPGCEIGGHRILVNLDYSDRSMWPFGTCPECGARVWYESTTHDGRLARLLRWQDVRHADAEGNRPKETT